jgi:DNA-binding NarL/FixJ family response regulator
VIDTRPAAPEPRAHTRCPLDPIELTIVRHLADGETRAQIARAANLTETSLNTAIARMFHLTGATNATSLVATALRAGWIR